MVCCMYIRREDVGGQEGGIQGELPVCLAGRAWKAWEDWQDWQGKVLSKMQVNSKERKVF